jgi:hypothetical protein
VNTFFQNNIQLSLQDKNLVLYERFRFLSGLFSLVSGDSSITSWVECTFVEFSSTFEGTITIKSMDIIILIEPKSKNGSLNPPILYNHAPTAGPVIHFC